MPYESLVEGGAIHMHLEYANSVWNPHRLGLIKDLEKVGCVPLNWLLVLRILLIKIGSKG